MPTQSVVARVVRGATGNFDPYRIEIDKGSSSGIEAGMPVVNQAGLVGKVTRVLTNSARVMLIGSPAWGFGLKGTLKKSAIFRNAR